MAIQRLLDGLRTQKVQPVVYCPRLAENGHGDPLVNSGYEVQRFKAFVPVLGLSRERKRQLVAVGGNLMSFDLLPALWRDRGLSIIHAHTLGRIGGIGLTAAKRRHVPFVVTVHGGVLDLPEKLKRAFNAPLEGGWEWGKFFGLLLQSHRLFRDAAAILTCNAREAELLQQQLPDKQVLVQPHGVPLEMYREDCRGAAETAFPQIRDRELLLSLGRIDPVKNQLWLVEEAPAVFERHPRALLVLAGPCTDEPYGALLNRRIRELGIESQVLLTGGLPPNDPRVIGLLQSGRVLLLPSISETFGLVILEAWASGTMVIASRASGPAALVEHGQNGWLFSLDDPSEFHTALDQTLTRPGLAREMVSRGVKVAEQYSIQALAGRLKLLYEHLIEEHHALRNHTG